MDGKLLREDIKDRGNSCLTDPRGFLLQAGQGDKVSKMGDSL